jgi:hypothetical protein
MLMEFIGWIGSFLVVGMYGLNSYQKIRSDSLIFYLANLAGGVLLIVYSIYKDALPNTFINVVWVMIAIPAIIRHFSRHSKPRRD